jgi:precorrin-2/cobalt-factor-2 C20-methyltransferase
MSAHGTVHGTLYGVGVGPGDPELMSLKAARILKSAPVVAYFAKKGNGGNAKRIVEGHLNTDAELLRLDYPFTTEMQETDPRYREALSRFYDESAAVIAAHLSQGRDVAVLCIGDPFFYGSYAHLHERLCGRHVCEVIPGITAMSGCWTRAQMPMVCGDGMLAVLSGTMEEGLLAERLRACEAAVIMKVGRNLPKIRAALTRTGLLQRALYVERGTMPEERMCPLAEKPDDTAAYFGIVLVPGSRRPL